MLQTHLSSCRVFLPRGSLLLIRRDMTFFPALSFASEELSSTCRVMCHKIYLCNQPIAELLSRVIIVCSSTGLFVREELLEYLPILFLSHVFMPLQLDSVTDFHGHAFSVSQHSGFQVIWSNNSLWTFFKIRCQRCLPRNLSGWQEGVAQVICVQHLCSSEVRHCECMFLE